MNDMKFYLFILVLIIIACNDNNNLIKTKTNSVASDKAKDDNVSSTQKKNNYLIDDFCSNLWHYEYIKPDDDLPIIDFSIAFEKINDSIVKGWYSSISNKGNKIDCADPDEENTNAMWNMRGKYNNDTLYVSFTGFFDRKAKGNAKIYFKNKDSIEWKIDNYSGKIYAPYKAVLWKEKK